MTDVKFNTALIVGAGAGLSASLARALAKDGIKVALAARTTGDLDALVKETGARAFTCDATKRGEVEKLFADLDASLGTPDIVVYNASFRTRGPFVELDPLDVEKALAVTSSRCAASLRAWRASCRRRASTWPTSWSTAASGARAGPTRPTLPTARSIPTPSPRATCTSSISPAAPGRGRSSCGRGWRNSDTARVASGRKERTMTAKVTIPALLQMKRDGRKSVGVVAWDYQIARIADRAGVDIVSVGDSVGVNLWGHSNPLEVTMDEMLVVCKAVRRGVTRALVSCDFPYGPLQEGCESAVRAAIRLVKEGGADMVKLDGAADFPETVRALTRAGIPVFAQFGITPQTALRYGIRRPVARRQDAHGAHRHRLRREMDRRQDRDLRQCRQDQPRRVERADRGRARWPSDQGLIDRVGSSRPTRRPTPPTPPSR